MKRNFDGVDNYAIHEYYQLDHGDGWSNDPVSIDGESIEDVKKSRFTIPKNYFS